MVDLSLTDLIDISIIQSLQDAFSEYTGMAALTTDSNGVPVTRQSGFTRFCELTRASELGCKHCNECDKNGAILTLDSGKPSSYYCHAGLVDFAAPIMLQGKFIGSFIGGQVRTEEVDEQFFLDKAEHLGINPVEYLEEAKNTRKIEKKQVDKAATFLAEIAHTLSETAYRNYLAVEKSRKMEYVAKIQTSQVLALVESLQKKVNSWIRRAQDTIQTTENDQLKEFLQNILLGGVDTVRNIQETLDYIKASEDNLELYETVYNVKEMMDNLSEKIHVMEGMDDVCLNVQIDPSVPDSLLGDERNIWQVLYRLILNAIHFSDKKPVWISVKSNRISYSNWLIFKVRDEGEGVDPQILPRIQKYFSDLDPRECTDEELFRIGFSTVANLVHKMGGKVSIENCKTGGTEIVVRIPQIIVGGEN